MTWNRNRKNKNRLKQRERNKKSAFRWECGTADVPPFTGPHESQVGSFFNVFVPSAEQGPVIKTPAPFWQPLMIIITTRLIYKQLLKLSRGFYKKRLEGKRDKKSLPAAKMTDWKGDLKSEKTLSDRVGGTCDVSRRPGLLTPLVQAHCLGQVRHQQAVDDESRCVLRAKRRLAVAGRTPRSAGLGG